MSPGAGFPPGIRLIAFFDGECGFCQGWVRRCVELDRAGAVRFAPLHGATWAALAESRRPVAEPLPDSLAVLGRSGGLAVRWRAVRRLLAALGPEGRCLAALAWLVPAGLGDLAYDAIAARRPRQARGPCRLPTAALRVRLLP